MVEVIISSVAAFIGTDIDDLLVLMFLFSQAAGKKDSLRIVAGKYIGIGLLFAISLLGSFGLNFLPERYIFLLGLIPVGLGIKSIVDHIKGKDDDDTDNIKRIGVLSVIALTFSGGADNIGVYVPLFTGYSVSEILVAAVVFALLTAVWCFIGSKLASLPFVRSFIEKYEHIIVPSVFILLGVYILLEGVL